MDRNDEAVFERWYGIETMYSTMAIREILVNDRIFNILYDAFEAGLERGKQYTGNGSCCEGH
jgi:hypothetical protein